MDDSPHPQDTKVSDRALHSLVSMAELAGYCGGRQFSRFDAETDTYRVFSFKMLNWEIVAVRIDTMGIPRVQIDHHSPIVVRAIQEAK